MLRNLKHCLNTVTFHVYPNKAYKLHEWYIRNMMHKPRHTSTCKWIDRVIKVNNYLMEFPTPVGVEAKKMDLEEILEVLEHGIPTLWNFQMDKEGFNESSSTIKEFTKTCVCYEECKPKIPEKQSAACMSHSEREGKCKAKHKADEKNYRKWGRAPPQHHRDGS
eukprot:7403160-Ditylum_brightwellii.AAC.1